MEWDKQQVRYMFFSDLNPDVVSTYLNDNPDFLEKYLLNHVTQDQLEYWVDQKRRHRAPQREYSSGSGDNNKINGQSEGINSQNLTIKMLSCVIFTHLKLWVATAIHNLKWVKITYIRNCFKTNANLENMMFTSPSKCTV